MPSQENTPSKTTPTQSSKPFFKNEDWWAVILGCTLLVCCLVAVYSQLPSRLADSAEGNTAQLTSPLKSWLSKPGGWKSRPLQSLFPVGESSRLPGLFGMFLVAMLCFGTAIKSLEGSASRFFVAFPIVFLLALLAFMLAAQEVVKYYSLSYALWALVAGLLISNTIGTPTFLKPAVRTELYIKTGLVVLGAEVLFSKLLVLGVPGIFVAWVVTPTVLISTFWFGQKILKIGSPSLNMVISADMSVCGVSAAIATAAACKAKKEELTAAIGLSLIFTVVMMVLMPAVIKGTGMSPVLGGAWMGGTIDSTGAVGAAGALLGDEALTVATTVKMIQNVLIGVVSFAVAVYWVRYQAPADECTQPSLREVWDRFPKFVIGFLFASIVFSAVYSFHSAGNEIVGAMISDSTKTLRGWFFCLAFVSIGLETNFKQLSQQFQGGKPMVLYVVGQTLNLCLTLFMAWLMFERVFPDAANVLMAK